LGRLWRGTPATHLTKTFVSSTTRSDPFFFCCSLLCLCRGACACLPVRVAAACQCLCELQVACACAFACGLCAHIPQFSRRAPVSVMFCSVSHSPAGGGGHGRGTAVRRVVGGRRWFGRRR
jgi:hypothetical protein